MTYQSTREVVRRVMPLLDQLATSSVDKARLLQYLSASAGVDWGVLEVAADRVVGGARVVTYRDCANGTEHSLVYPDVLAAGLRDLVVAEYKRLAVDRPLSLMDERLFAHFYSSQCASCVFRGPGNEQIHAECYFAGYPVNFEPTA